MLEDYKKAVISYYHNKKEKGPLSLNLSHPTPAKLRDDCLLVLSKRYLPKDDSTLELFFGHSESKDYSPSIKRFDADKFKPLVNYLKERTNETEDKNIELLAWLIDFEPRPYDYKADYTKQVGSEEHPPATPERQNPTPKPPGPTPPVPALQRWPIARKAIWSGLIICLMTSGVYIYRDHTDKAYICDRGTAKKYHLNPKCPALKNCINNPVSTTITEAEKNGKTRCGFEPI